MSKKTIIWIVVIIAVAALIYFLYNYFKNKRDQNLLLGVNEKGSTTGPVTNSGGGTSTVTTDAFPLKIGSKGSNVQAAQIALNKAGCLYGGTIAEDGSFGPLTAGAADKCLKSKNGHVAGQISYAEYVYLKNKALAGSSTGGASGAGTGAVSTSMQQLAITSCGDPSTRLWFESLYGVQCSSYGL